jgi:hypothetical protein
MRCGGQREEKCAALSRLALNAHRATKLSHCSLHDREPEAMAVKRAMLL